MIATILSPKRPLRITKPLLIANSQSACYWRAYSTSRTFQQIKRSAWGDERVEKKYVGKHSLWLSASDALNDFIKIPIGKSTYDEIIGLRKLTFINLIFLKFCTQLTLHLHSRKRDDSYVEGLHCINWKLTGGYVKHREKLFIILADVSSVSPPSELKTGVSKSYSSRLLAFSWYNPLFYTD